MDTDMMQVIKEFGLDAQDVDESSVREREREYIKLSLAQCDEVIAKIKQEMSKNADN